MIALMVGVVVVVGGIFLAGSVGKPVESIKPGQLPQSGWTEVSRTNVVTAGGTYVFAQQCAGQTQTLEGQERPFCLGLSRLTVTNPAGAQEQLETANINEAKDVPVLIGASVVPGSANGEILVSYAPETCTTAGDCGVGAPDNFVGGMYRSSDGSYRELNNFPEMGLAVWNANGTKALFVQPTCGPTGCGKAPIYGYDLASDTGKGVTQEFAAGAPSDVGRALDPMGNPLPQWVSVAWKDEMNFSAVYRPETGPTKEIAGKL